MLREDAQARLAQRRAVAEKLAAAKAAHEKARPALAKAMDAKARECREAEAAVRKARAAFSEAEWRLHEADHTAEAEARSLERELVTSAPSEIDAFIAGLDVLAETLRKVQPAELEVKSGWTGLPIVVGSNYKARVAMLGRILEGRQASEALKLEPLSEAELQERLDEIRRGIGSEPGLEAITPGRPEYAAHVEAFHRRARGGDDLPPAA
jgi:hypothetical protein